MASKIKNMNSGVGRARSALRSDEAAIRKKEREAIYNTAVRAAVARKRDKEKDLAADRDRSARLVTGLAKTASFILLLGMSAVLVSKVFTRDKEQVPVVNGLKAIHPGTVGAGRAEKFVDEILECVKRGDAPTLEGIWNSNSDDECRVCGAALLSRLKEEQIERKRVFAGALPGDFTVLCEFRKGKTIKLSVREEGGKHTIVCVE